MSRFSAAFISTIVTPPVDNQSYSNLTAQSTNHAHIRKWTT